MALTVRALETLTAMPTDFTPLLDFEGYPLEENYIRLMTPKSFYRALDDLEGGHEEDPRHPGCLGSRWYRIGDKVLSRIDTTYTFHDRYRNLLRLLTWSQPRQDPQFAQTEPFWDLIHFPDNEGVIAHRAITRLADDYRRLPDISERSRDYAFTIPRSQIDELCAHHVAWGRLVTEAAAHEFSALRLS